MTVGQDALTVLVRRSVRPGRKPDFEDAMRTFIVESLRFPGSEAIHVVRPCTPSHHEYTVFHRFADAASRRKFVASGMYREWMARLRELSESEPNIEELGGTAGWFTLPGRPPTTPPPKWRMALVTFLGVYPLTSLLPGFFSRILPGVHPLAVNVVTTGSIVALLTWVLMPCLTRAFARWLFGREQLAESAS